MKALHFILCRTGHFPTRLLYLSLVLMFVLGSSSAAEASPGQVNFDTTLFTTGSGSTSAAVGDFNRDGKLDLVVVNQTGGGGGQSTVSVLLGKGDGTFQAALNLPAGNTTLGVVTGDFNNDGNLDFAVAINSNNRIALYLGKGNGAFSAPVHFASGGLNPLALSAADYNGDGKLDLAVTNYAPPGNETSGTVTGVVSILLGMGNGSFAEPVNFPVSAAPYSIVSEDVNGDGKTDLVVANLGGGSAPGSVSILLGNGDGTFRHQMQFGVGKDLHPHFVTAADFNGDGIVDLATADSGASNSVSVLLGKGNGTFGSPKLYAAGNVPFGIAAGDFNGDGKIDLAAANFETLFPGIVSVLLGNGDGTFQSQVQFEAGDEPYSVIAADFNGDGKVDLAAPDFFSSSVAILLNTSTER